MRGSYFKYKSDGFTLKSFEEVKDQLPEPILEDQMLIEMYWFALKLAFKNAKPVGNENKLISCYQDTCFNQNLFLWDSVFISRFLILMHDFLPGIRTLDNFYYRQKESGLINREMHSITGEDYPKWVNKDGLSLHSYFHLRYRYRGLNHVNETIPIKFYDLKRNVKGTPDFTLDALNHPILSYGEYAYYLHTGDKERLLMVHESLYRYYEALFEHLRHRSHLFVTDWASMDNSTRNEQLFLGVDISSEMVMFAKDLVKIYKVLEDESYQERIIKLERDIQTVTEVIQRNMWDPETKFFYDLDEQENQIKIKTIAGFWPMLAEIVTEEQKEALSRWLEDPTTFNRVNVVPALAADEPGYDPKGGYWRGGVWASTNLMVTDGLERIGNHTLAKKIAHKYLQGVLKVYEKTNTLWELYPPDELSEGNSDHKDFVGWTGLAPILYLIQYQIGLKADADNQVLHWELDIQKPYLGIKRFRFLEKEANFYAKKNSHQWEIHVETTSTFKLEITNSTGNHSFDIHGNTSFFLEV